MLMALLLFLNSLLELHVNHVVVSWINATMSLKILKLLIFPGIALYARDTWGCY
jgi:hypothetical protein